MAHYVTFIDPHTLLNLNMALEITIYATPEGRGRCSGPLIGALFLVPLADLVRTALGQSYAVIHLVVYGAVLTGGHPIHAGRLHRFPPEFAGGGLLAAGPKACRGVKPHLSPYLRSTGLTKASVACAPSRM